MPNDVPEVVATEAKLDALPEDATASDVWRGTFGLGVYALAAVAAKQARSGGGGGASFPDEWTVGEQGTLDIAPSGPAAAGSSALTVSGAATIPTLTVGADDGGIRFDALVVGGALVTVQLKAGEAVTGVTVDVTGTDIVIEYEAGPTTANDVIVAVNGDPAASALIEATATGAGTDPPSTADPAQTLHGSNAYALDLHGNEDPAALHGEYVLVWRDETGAIVGHLDNDGGAVFSNEAISFSELGNVLIDNQNPTAGQPIFEFKHMGGGLLGVSAPGGGYGATIGGFAAGDIPFLIFAAGSQTADLVEVYDGNGDVPRFRLDKDARPVTRVNTAPADGALAANECGMWFDSSDGAAKVMFKGKTADGTVVDGELALS